MLQPLVLPTPSPGQTNGRVHRCKSGTVSWVLVIKLGFQQQRKKEDSDSLKTLNVHLEGRASRSPNGFFWLQVFSSRMLSDCAAMAPWIWRWWEETRVISCLCKSEHWFTQRGALPQYQVYSREGLPSSVNVLFSFFSAICIGPLLSNCLCPREKIRMNFDLSLARCVPRGRGIPQGSRRKGRIWPRKNLPWGTGVRSQRRGFSPGAATLVKHLEKHNPNFSGKK